MTRESHFYKLTFDIKSLPPHTRWGDKTTSIDYIAYAAHWCTNERADLVHILLLERNWIN